MYPFREGRPFRPQQTVRARLRGKTPPEPSLNATAKTALQPAVRSDRPDPADSLCEEMSRANAAELAQMYESLQRRERLLAASANASRLLLEAPDVMAAVPHVLRQLGEAAAVDRVNLMLAQTGPNGERLLVVAAEWVAEGVVPHLGHPT